MKSYGFSIPLSNGGFTTVDEIDYELSGMGKWYKGRQGRVELLEDHSVVLHQLIANRMGIPLGYEIDHADRNKLNNTRSNLRGATRAQNNRNRRNFKNSVSKYKGVFPKRGKWASSIMVDGKRIWIGYFDTETEAAKAYDDKAKELHAEFATLNFPETLQSDEESYTAGYAAGLKKGHDEQSDDTKRLDWYLKFVRGFPVGLVGFISGATFVVLCVLAMLWVFSMSGCCSQGEVPYPCNPFSPDYHQNNIFGNVNRTSPPCVSQGSDACQP